MTGITGPRIGTEGGGGQIIVPPTLPVPGLTTLDALSFGGSNGVHCGFRWTNPPDPYPLTCIWRVRPRDQAAYSTIFFWGNYGNFRWDNGAPNTYHGAAIYPTGGFPQFGERLWEIPVDAGDEVDTVDGGLARIRFDRWKTQVYRAFVDAQGNKVHEYYLDWPRTDDAVVIRVVIDPGYGNILPPSPTLIFGDAGWPTALDVLSGQGYEVLLGDFYGLTVYNGRVLTLEEIAAEVKSPRSAVAPWYFRYSMLPSADNSGIADLSGKNNHPIWVSERRPGALRLGG